MKPLIIIILCLGCSSWQIPPDQLDAEGQWHNPAFDIPKLTMEDLIENDRIRRRNEHREWLKEAYPGLFEKGEE